MLKQFVPTKLADGLEAPAWKFTAALFLLPCLCFYWYITLLKIITMKYYFSAIIFSFSLLLATAVQAQQDKTKRASPPAKVSEKIKSGATISIDYSQPSLKGREIGSSVEPMKDQVWRMGANEATVFETDKDVTINGEKLPAGKYSLFGLWTDKDYTLIFNKAAQIWGTQYNDHKTEDALRVPANVKKTDKVQEKLTYTIDKSGLVSLLWGNMDISFNVK